MSRVSKYDLIHKPETALKRADELITIGQQSTALSDLHEWIVNKKYKTFTEAHELLMQRLIQLGTQLKQGRMIKEALHAYKNMSLNVSLPSLARLVDLFLSQCRKRVELAVARKEDTLESVLFLWEAYRAVLDVLKLNAKLEPLYQSVAVKAFQFCLANERKLEMRRLCDLLRGHLVQLARVQNTQAAAYNINLGEAASMEMHLKTRFVQLDAVVELELFQEAFRTCEDIYALAELSCELRKTKQSPLSAEMKLHFYGQLSKVLLIGGDELFHAAALIKYFDFSQQQGVQEQELKKISLQASVAVLAIPLHADSACQDDNQIARCKRLSALIGLKSIPTRKWLLSQVAKFDMLSQVSEETKTLFGLLVNEKIVISDFAQKFDEAINALSDIEQYKDSLSRVVLSRIVLFLCHKPQMMKMSEFMKVSGRKLTAFQVEKFLVAGVQRGEYMVRIDHQTESIEFVQCLVVDEATQQQSAMEKLMGKLQTLSKQVAPSQEMVDFEKLAQELEKQHADTLERHSFIEKRKQRFDQFQAESSKELAAQRLLKAQQEAETERLRLAQEQRKREIERIQKDREEIEKAQAQKLADEMLKKNIKIDVEDLEQMDKAKLLRLQIQQMESEKSIREKKLGAIAKRLDYTERAYRLEEAPLIAASYDAQKKADLAAHQKAYKMLKDATKIKHQRNLQLKASFKRMKFDWQTFEAEKSSDFKKRVEQRRADALTKIKAEKQLRLEQLKLEKFERLCQQAEKENQLAAQEKLRQEEEAKLAVAQAEQRTLLLKEKEIRDAQMRDANEKAQLQLKREQEAEENRRQRNLDAQLGSRTISKPSVTESQKPQSTNVYVPRFRQDVSSRPSSGNFEPKLQKSSLQVSSKNNSQDSLASSTKSDKFIPPHLRKKAEAAASTGSGNVAAQVEESTDWTQVTKKKH